MNDDEILLKEYKDKINDFENKYVKDNFQNYKKYDSHRGYLINLECYNNLKKKIQDYYDRKVSASTAVKNLNKLNDIAFKTSSYLINMILNGNKYIIINTTLWKLFGNKERPNNQILYDIDKNLIYFSLDSNIPLKFACYLKNNIIDDSSFSQYYNEEKYYTQLTSNFKVIEKIYQEISVYYYFETKIIENIKCGEKVEVQLAYLIDENWMNQWMKQTNYEEFRKIFSKITDRKLIKDQIIYFGEKNKTNKLGIPKIIIKQFKNIEELKYYLENNSLVLVNFSFVYNFDENNNNCLYYSTSKNGVKLIINGAKIDIPSKNNIISLKQNNINLIKDEPDSLEIVLKPLITFFYLNEEIKMIINFPHEQKYNGNNEVYYIN